MAQETKRRFTLIFRILNMAQKDMAKALGAFSPALGQLGGLFAKFTSVAVKGFSTIGVAGVAAAGSLLIAFFALKKVMQAVAAALRSFVDFLKDAIKVGFKFQDSVTLIKAAGGLAEEQVAALGTRLAEVGVNSLQAAKGIETLVRAGAKGQEAADMFSTVAFFSKAVGASVQQTSQLLIGALRAFDLMNNAAENSVRVLKAMSFAILRTRFNFETFTTAFAFGGAAAAGFGRDLEGTVTIMSLFMDMGLRASTVGTTIRNMLTRLAKPTRQAQIALAQYGISLKGILKPGRSWEAILKDLIPLQNDLEAATALFGRRTAGFITKLLQKMSSSMTATGNIFRDRFKEMQSSGILFADVMRDKLRKATGQFDAFIGQVQTFKVELFRALEPAIVTILAFGNSVLKGIRDSFQKSAPLIQLLALRILDFAFIIKDVAIGSLKALAGAIAGFLLAVPGLNIIFVMTVRLVREWTIGNKGLVVSLLKMMIRIKKMARGVLELRRNWNLLTRDRKEAVELERQRIKLGREIVKDRLALSKAMRGLKTGPEEGVVAMKVLNEEIAKMKQQLFKAEELRKKNADKAEMRQKKITKAAGTAIIDLSKALTEKGPGEFLNRLLAVTKKFGPELGEMFRKAAIQFAGAGTLAEEQFNQLRDKLAQEKSVLNIFFGLDAKQRNNIIRGAEKLGGNVVAQLDAVLGARPKTFLESLIGGKTLTPEEMSIVKKKFTAFEKAMANIRMKQVRFELEGEGDMSRERANKMRIELMKKFIAEVDLVNRKTETFNNTLKKVQQTFNQISTGAGDRFAETLKKIRDSQSEGTKPALEFAKALASIAPKIDAMGKKASVLGDTIKNKMVLDVIAGIKSVKDIDAALTKIKGFNKVSEDVKKARAGMNSLTNEQLAQLKAKLAELDTAPLTGLARIAAEARKMAKDFKETNDRINRLDKSLGKSGPGLTVFLQQIGKSRKEALRTREEEVLALAEADKTAVTQLSDTAKKRMIVEARQKEDFENRMKNMNRFGRESVKAFGTFMKSVSSSFAQSLVDDSVNFKDAFSNAIDQMKAKLIELALQEAILRPLFNLLGGGGGFFGSIFGFQSGTGLGGVPGMGNRPDSVPARLTPGEIVLDRSASDLFRGMIASGGTGGGDINISISALDGGDVKRVMEREIIPDLNRRLKNNTGTSAATSIRANRLNRRRAR